MSDIKKIAVNNSEYYFKDELVRNSIGVASSETSLGIAPLDASGKVPSENLPSYVDDVLEYDTKSVFPAQGESGKIYVDKSTDTTWRWSGSQYTQIKGDLTIGTTIGTAADGGIANTHYSNKNNPHNVTKTQVGLGDVVNTGDSATPVEGGTTKFTTGGAYTELAKKVDKVTGKGLSTNDYTNEEKNKLANIAAGAEVNVQVNWNEDDSSSDAFIQNKPVIPQLPVLSNGHEYVDLGLPSGTLWATMNVGATSETDYGNYYMYGMGSKTYDSADTPYAGTEDPLDLSKDTARVAWGGLWHMPTKAQIQELIDNTTYQWVTNYKGSGINGGTFTATNGAVLFFPAAGNWYNGSQEDVGNDGYYWGSSPEGSNRAYDLYFNDGDKDVYNNVRKSGYSVRPVITPSNTLHKVSVTGDYNDLSNKPTIPAAVAVKGNAETEYRTGNVNITPANIGLGNVDNTADADKSVNYANSAGNSKTVGGYDLYRFLIFGGKNVDYVTADFLDIDLSQKAHQKYIEFWDGGTDCGWFNFKVGSVNAVDGGLMVNGNQVIHTGNISSYIPTSLPANGGNADTVDNYHASSLAKVQSANNFIHDSNEITFVPSGYSGYIWINYRTEGGTNGSITDYKLGDGSGNELGTVLHTGNWSNFITIPTTLPASDVYSWAKAPIKPSYTASEVGISSSVQPITSNTSSSCSITGSSNDGKSQTIIYTNSTSSDLTVTVPTTYKTPDGAAIEITCKAGGYCEVNYLNIGGTIYARGL